MNHRVEDLAPLFPDQNPFSTWAVRPGAIRFRFRDGVTREQLLADLEEHDWWGQILGPHGSGKSTLLHELTTALEESGRKLMRYKVRPGERQMPIATGDLQGWSSGTQVVIEGFEILGARNRKMFESICRRRHVGLLITCHESLGFPTLYETSISLELAQELVRDLLPADCDFINGEDVAGSFERQGQNLRELLFEMYDLYEKRRPRDRDI